MGQTIFMDSCLLKFMMFRSGVCADRNLYTIRAISLAEMRSIRRHTPPLGWQYIIIVLQSGAFLNVGVRLSVELVFVPISTLTSEKKVLGSMV